MMADTCEKPLSCPGPDGPSNLGREAGCYAKAAALRDQLADCLFQMEAENTSCAPLDALLNQLYEATPLPEGKAFDTEQSLAAFHQAIHNVHCSAPCALSFTNRVSPGVFSPWLLPLVAYAPRSHNGLRRKSMRAGHSRRFIGKKEPSPWPWLF